MITKTRILVAIVACLTCCGMPFVEEPSAENEDCDIYVLDPGEFEAPIDDVAVERPRPHRPAPDAGTRSR